MCNGAWILDSGASRFVVNHENVDDQIWDTVQAAGTIVETAAGPTNVESTVDVHVPSLGEFREALVMRNAPNMASLGITVEDHGYNFTWMNGNGPRLWKGNHDIPLVVVDKVPMILGSLS